MWDIVNAAPAVILPALMFYFFFLVPLRKVRRARTWRETPCVIVASGVREDKTESGLYWIDVTYQYRVGGRDYLANRYNFSIGSTSGRRGKKRLMARLPPGTHTTCYVNPDDPSEAVLDRRLTWDVVVMGVFAVGFWAAFAFVFIR